MDSAVLPTASLPAAMIGVGLLLFAAVVWGRHCFWPAPGCGSKPLDCCLIAVAIGLNLIAFAGLVLSPLAAISRLQPAWVVTFLTGVMIAYRLWKEGWQALRPAPVAKIGSSQTAKSYGKANRRSAETSSIGQSKSGDRLAPLRTVTITLLALITLGPALCPPTGWDELVYHHELPRRWLADGWPAVYLDLPYSAFPSLAELLFWIVGPLEAVISPRLLSWTCWIFGLALSHRLLRRILRPHLAVVVLLSLAASSSALMISANCYVEALQLMNVAALLAILHNRRLLRRFPIRAAIGLGVLAGGTVSIKLTALPVLVVPVVWLLVARWRRGLAAPASARFVGAYLAAAVCVALPFYLRPWLLTGDPVYPYYTQWFSVDPVRAEMSQYHHALGSSFGIHGWIGLVFGPIFLAFDHQLYDGDFGGQLPILLGLAILAVFRCGKRNRTLASLASAVVLFVFWFLTAQQARFLIPAAVLVAVAGAQGLRAQNIRWRSIIAMMLLAATLYSAPWRTRGHYLGSWMCAIGLISQTTYVDESTDRNYIPLVSAIGEHTPADARLLLLFEHRGFYIPRQYQIGTPFFQERGFTPPEQFSDAKAVLEILGRNSISHLVVTTKPTGPDLPAAWLDRLDPLLAALNRCIEAGSIVPVWQSDRHILYEVRLPKS